MTHAPELAATDAAELAHEIRNALTPLMNSLQVIRLVAGDDPDVKPALRVIDRQIGRLGQVADRISSGAPVGRDGGE